MVRYYEEKSTEPVKFCSDVDFETAFWLVKHSIKSSLSIYRTLPNTKDLKIGDQKSTFFRALPDEFDTNLQNQVATLLKVSERTISRWVNQFVANKILEKVGKGRYRKNELGKIALDSFTT